MMKKIFYSMVTYMMLTVPTFILAQETGAPGAVTPTPPVKIDFKLANPFTGGSSLVSVINAILQNIVMPLAAVVVVLAIIYSGFKYVMAQGNSKEIQDANQGLLYVLIGTAVLLGATGISAAIQGTICGSLITC